MVILKCFNGEIRNLKDSMDKEFYNSTQEIEKEISGIFQKKIKEEKFKSSTSELKTKMDLIKENNKLKEEIEFLEERENQIMSANFTDYSELGKKMIDHKILDLKKKFNKEEEKLKMEFQFFEIETGNKLEEFLSKYNELKKENQEIKLQNRKLNEENSYLDELNCQIEGKIRRKKFIENYIN